MTSSLELRNAFTDFFIANNHKYKESASLVPDDKTLLFTNAGMVPFKQVFTGAAKAPANRVTSIQRCVRAGGKHNDLENVGVTARHHTLFEMMGNFSFGDYFKEQAIGYAWEFVTQVCQIDPNKLVITYHHSDLETKSIWHKQIGIPESRLIACGDKDNFWSMGAVGPCGPCTEIFYDHGSDVKGGPPGSADEDGDRFVEIWNLVFMQFNQTEDGVRLDLPKPCVDTGSGLERFAAVLQGVHDNYETDQFKRLINITKGLQQVSLSDVTYRVLADHSRAIACLLNDKVMPSNEGRGYVLRRLLRRAACFMHRDGQTQPLLADILAEACVDPLLSVMRQDRLQITLDTVKQEELQFSDVISQGVSAIQDLVDAGATSITGEQAFKLYDTYGLPFDLTKDLAAARKISVDESGFNACMSEQKARSRNAANFAKHSKSAIEVTAKSDFIGYESNQSQAVILSMFDKDWQAVTSMQDTFGYMVLDQSVFYAESGGQVADVGSIMLEDNIFTVKDVQKYNEAIVISGDIAGSFSVGQSVNSKIDLEARNGIRSNHSATHLLHAALREILGSHVEQKGSMVAKDCLRFDFSHSKPVTHEQIQLLEAWVLKQIRQNLPVTTKITSFAEAKESGAMALFEGKYGDTVRLLSIGDVSLELCGGTHVKTTNEIGNFAIISEAAVASGVRRITAVTADTADEHYANANNNLYKAAEALGCNAKQLDEKIMALNSKIETYKAQKHELTASYVQQRIKNLNSKSNIVLSIEPFDDANAINDLADQLIKSYDLVILLTKYSNGKHMLIVASNSKDYDANQIIKFLAKKFSGKGGGKSSFARGQLMQSVCLNEIEACIAEFKLSTNDN